MRLYAKKSQVSSARGRVSFWLLLCLIAATGLFYGYGEGRTVWETVLRGELEKERNSLAISVGELETRYLSAKRGITVSAARSLGFETAAVARFITKRTITALRSGAEL